MKKHLAFYGNVRIPRIWCSECKGMTLVINDVKQCCDEGLKAQYDKKKIICEVTNKRRIPKYKEQQRILEIQQNKCLYCNKEFGTPYFRNGKLSFLKLHFDHLVPYAYSRNNKMNFVAACNVCNGLKSSKVFETVEEVFYYVEYNRKKKGITYYEDLPAV